MGNDVQSSSACLAAEQLPGSVLIMFSAMKDSDIFSTREKCWSDIKISQLLKALGKFPADWLRNPS